MMGLERLRRLAVRAVSAGGTTSGEAEALAGTARLALEAAL